MKRAAASDLMVATSLAEAGDQLIQRPLHEIIDGRIQKAGRLLHERGPAQVFVDASRQSVVDQIVDFAVNALARDEYFFHERKLFVVLITPRVD